MVIGVGQNRVTRDNDPTAHAEVQAIRAACPAIENFSLEGSTVYTSCEPCPLCLAACLWARVDRVVFAADRNDAARAGFDDSAFYDLFASHRDTWPMPVRRSPRARPRPSRWTRGWPGPCASSTEPVSSRGTSSTRTG